MEIVKMEEVVFGYGDVPSLVNASLSIRQGEFVALTGPNGASKSTALRLMLGLLKPWSGLIQLADRCADSRPLTVGYVPQQLSAFNSGFPSTVKEFVLSGRYRKGAWLKRLLPEDHRKVEEGLRQVGMWEHRGNRIGELSGGQKQRICIARTLVQEPDFFVLDEPVTGMDKNSRMDFYQLMEEQVRGRGSTVLMVTHNLEEVKDRLDRIIELERTEEGGWRCCTTTSCRGHFMPAG
ncbi:metal ABC transporter ATP-binding protein [Gorillibacterium timonense]|uniref:metal ABC transporter ATP-binding protein n=1 Tax=Gorillibacterium timonense TaxID=1689269 RepID=UPI000D52579E|nr:metal ABC transporter ATP-binding protein [Gorillibacterium timonense]